MGVTYRQRTAAFARIQGSHYSWEGLCQFHHHLLPGHLCTLIGICPGLDTSRGHLLAEYFACHSPDLPLQFGAWCRCWGSITEDTGGDCHLDQCGDLPVLSG